MTAFRTVEPIKAFWIFQVLDIFSTFLGFSVGMHEANPVIRHFFPIFGSVIGLVLGKLLTSVILYFYVIKLTEEKQRKLWKVANIFFMLLISYNLILVAIRILGSTI